MLFCLRTGVTALLLALAAVVPPTLVQQPRSTTSAITSDPPRDSKYPAAAAGPRIAVRGSHINGYLMVASGAGPHPTVLLLHGFAGYEGLLDVGEALRRAGINVLAIHYRGAWGSEGTFTFGGSVDDAEAAIGWLKDPKTAAQYRIDTSRIYAVGHSFGGFVAMMLAAHTHDVKAVAYISGWDIVSDAAPWLAKPTQAAIDDFEQSAQKYGRYNRGHLGPGSGRPRARLHVGCRGAKSGRPTNPCDVCGVRGRGQFAAPQL